MKSLFACIPLFALSAIAWPFKNLVSRDSVTVHFIDNATTGYGEVSPSICRNRLILIFDMQNIYVVGSIYELGNWAPDFAVRNHPYVLVEWH